MSPSLPDVLQWLAGLGGFAAVALLIIVQRALPSYGSEKGKNLATKEDVAEITRRIEEVRAGYAAGLETIRAEHVKDVERLKSALATDAKVRQAQ